MVADGLSNSESDDDSDAVEVVFFVGQHSAISVEMAIACCLIKPNRIMTPEQILNNEPRVFSQKQRESYFANGYMLVDKIIPDDWVNRLIWIPDEVVERSRSLSKSDAVFDLEPGHIAARPRLRRLTSPVEHYPVCWEFASESVLADIAADLVGSDVKFHHSKLNFKWAEGDEEVK